MATRNKFTQSVEERRRRSFSEEFKRAKVREIDQKVTRIADVCRQYEVSEHSVLRWVRLYSGQYMKSVRTIVESESDTKRLLEMQAKIAELERALGQKQLQLDFKDKMIELAERMYGVDIKKKFGVKP